MRTRKGRGIAFGSCRQFGLAGAGAIARQERLRIHVHSDGIVCKRCATHEVEGVFRTAGFDLQLDAVAVRILVIKGERKAVMNRPVRGKSLPSLSLS